MTTDAARLAVDDLHASLVEVERAARAFANGTGSAIRKSLRLGQALERVDGCRERCVELTPGHYLVARAPGCTCEILEPGNLSGPDPYPPEWDQNPNCPVHPAP